MTVNCAVSFLCVLAFTTGVGIAAFVIIWQSRPSSDASDSCSEDTWKCKEEDVCIPKASRCNQVKDCPQGSDEDVIDCGDMTHTVDTLVRMYDSLFSCERKRNESDPIPGPAKNPVVNITIPQGCMNVSRAIFCKDLDWKRVPWDRIPSTAKTLTLDNVLHLQELTDELFVPSETTISKLNVENNMIISLGKSSVCNWDNVCWMSFKNNQISRISSGAFCEFPKTRLLRLSNNKITLEDFWFPKMASLEELFLEHNLIEVISNRVFRQLKRLISLNLMGNRIRVIEERAFRYCSKLQYLDLSNNNLKQLAPSVFELQTHLKKLDLSENPLEHIPGKAFSNLKSLTSLNLSGIESSAFEFDSLKSISTLDYAHFKKFAYCRYVPMITRCYPFSDGMSSVLNLLAGNSVRWIVWIVALLTIVGNSIVLFTRCLYGGRESFFDVFINNLAAADMLMGVYLVIIAVKDIQYRDSYNEYAYEWSTSLLCSGIGIMAMISCEASLLILTFMSVERFLVISSPFSIEKLSLNLSRISMIIIWTFVVALAIAPAIQWRGKYSFYGSSGLCFPVHLDEPYGIGWQYTTFVVVGLNTMCLVIVAVSYSKLFSAVRATRLATTVQNKDMEMAVRILLMVFTDCLCWLPIIFLKIYALSGNQIPKEFITWVVIFVLPINSTINPYLYTLSMPENRMRLFRSIIPMAALRRSINLLRPPLRRHGAVITVTDESHGTNWTSNSTTVTNDKAAAAAAAAAAATKINGNLALTLTNQEKNIDASIRLEDVM